MVLNLKLRRIELAFTQWDLGAVCAIKPSRYSLIERGLIEPSDEERERLAQVLQVPAATLLHPVRRVRPANSAQSTVPIGV